MDALHLACAETLKVDVFLTVDAKLVNKGRKHENILEIRVEKPVVWLQVVIT